MPLNRPRIDELVEAVSEFLRQELLPAQTDKALGYQLRVAINVLAIVQRELAQGDRLAQLERDLLGDYLGQEGDSASLSQALVRDIQTLDLQSEEARRLLVVLEKISAAKLAIDNPRYSSFQDYLQRG